jgi:hypothetical protein
MAETLDGMLVFVAVVRAKGFRAAGELYDAARQAFDDGRRSMK